MLLDVEGGIKYRFREFVDPTWTARGERRALVPLTPLETLWFNTGTLCNIACANCYIESSPKNDRLAYLTLPDALPFLDEIANLPHRVSLIGFTGGEPFMNPSFIAILEETLRRGFQTLTLTNALKPMSATRRTSPSWRIFTARGSGSGSRLMTSGRTFTRRREAPGPLRSDRGPCSASDRRRPCRGRRPHLERRRRKAAGRVSHAFSPKLRLRLDPDNAQALVVLPEMRPGARAA